MALAKAFPDTYLYEPQEPTSVSSLVFEWEMYLFLFIAFMEVKSFQLQSSDRHSYAFVLILRPQVSATPDPPLCRRPQLCPATPPPTTARPRTTTKRSAMTRTWRQRRTGWTSASPTPRRSKTSLLPSTGATVTATASRTRKTETRADTHIQYMLNLTRETLSVEKKNCYSHPCTHHLYKWVQLWTRVISLIPACCEKLHHCQCLPNLCVPQNFKNKYLSVWYVLVFFQLHQQCNQWFALWSKCSS